ncbi:hypothetical protein P3T76_004463 [Phytophthora citrophthora]|uniref:Uncharacterized protein n=1 Tax=Phytophthora citrophthora TaxID=4793 RepID=A0AAD9GUY3_9STRA|nr:hypothetical protein P3T76_004463 [Phytophthora citrophthora]
MCDRSQRAQLRHGVRSDWPDVQREGLEQCLEEEVRIGGQDEIQAAGEGQRVQSEAPNESLNEGEEGVKELQDSRASIPVSYAQTYPLNVSQGNSRGERHASQALQLAGLKISKCPPAVVPDI